MVPTPGSRRLESLTGLRFVAAFSVLLFHVWTISPDVGRGRYRLLFSSGGAVGVSFFFLLSGFVLTWSRRETTTAATFYRRRLARIYPAYLVALAAGAAVFYLLEQSQSGPLSLAGVVTSVALIQQWVPTQVAWRQLNPPGWSLSVELLFYAVFPVLAVRLGRWGRPARGVATACCLAVVVAIGVAGDVSTRTGLTGHIPDRFVYAYFFPPSRVAEFVLGILLALHLRDGRLPRIPLGLATVAAGTAYLVSAAIGSYWAVVALPVGPLCLLIVAAAQSDMAGRATVWNSPLLVRLGAASYCLYLVHYTVLRAVRGVCYHPSVRFTYPLVHGTVLLALVAPLSLLAAEALHRWVEVPGERRWAGRRDAGRPAAASLPAPGHRGGSLR